MRPAIIVGGANGLILIVPLTSSMSSARSSHTYTITPDVHNGLDVESVALVFQIVALDLGAVPAPDRCHRRTTAARDHCSYPESAGTGLTFF